MIWQVLCQLVVDCDQKLLTIALFGQVLGIDKYPLVVALCVHVTRLMATKECCWERCECMTFDRTRQENDDGPM